MIRIVAAFMAGVASLAHAELQLSVTVTPGLWDLFKGSSKAGSYPTQAACDAAADAAMLAKGIGTWTYSCKSAEKRVGVVTQTPIAPPPPPPVPTGSAHVSWLAPVNDAAGKPLQSLAGFRVYYGATPGAYTGFFDVADPLAAKAAITLPLGAWFFTVSAYDSTGNESTLDSEVSKDVQ
jgi:hypothetical protein